MITRIPAKVSCKITDICTLSCSCALPAFLTRRPKTTIGTMQIGNSTSVVRLNFQSIATSTTTPVNTATGSLMMLPETSVSAVCATPVSLITRDMSLPAFSRLKKSSDCDIRCANNFVRMSRSTRKLTHARQYTFR